ncbi:hypothetical protein CY34DRAFT_810615 [Suillus luteus UH-Slu-Lm8-n1]|uniref:Uncharacterized protein n=1 Tax=Suillus luteus UH-Slu-Lm8-n1 TaxID=930992 RepID=A0A0D0A6F0_9AGAM|nr:hypothetical protein CY34DRAFT_810615 [Suillus luteus UH-Slu-Lm8-n1]
MQLKVQDLVDRRRRSSACCSWGIVKKNGGRQNIMNNPMTYTHHGQGKRREPAIHGDKRRLKYYQIKNSHQYETTSN